MKTNSSFFAAMKLNRDEVFVTTESPLLEGQKIFSDSDKKMSFMYVWYAINSVLSKEIHQQMWKSMNTEMKLGVWDYINYFAIEFQSDIVNRYLEHLLNDVVSSVIDVGEEKVKAVIQRIISSSECYRVLDPSLWAEL